jgi:DnaJ-class molecular chaperone
MSKAAEATLETIELIQTIQAETTCSRCKGKGDIMVITGMRGEPDIDHDICPACDGKGFIQDDADKILEKNGVLYNSEDELDYQEDHEGSEAYHEEDN